MDSTSRPKAVSSITHSTAAPSSSSLTPVQSTAPLSFFVRNTYHLSLRSTNAMYLTVLEEQRMYWK
ncbi:hypothetical protein FIBSPDRAFT_526299 [Athelia psychrophila]|uniref:Uncharacterized protein n=1 Tax=Athelia psychrophila TaxID=1759441 RepID=A0A166JK51_9AGAM|nr:hypothetical protein FIBSPDRAFT_526299 [Fibularhizoctonia sp. CBS 109695]